MWLCVDYPTLLDALERAAELGQRIRPGDATAARSLFSEEGLDPSRLAPPIEDCLAPKAALISGGLYRGIFRYDLGSERAWKWHPRPLHGPPLRRFAGLEMLDVAVSYSSEDRDLALGLVDALRRQGLDVYAIDVAVSPDDTLWRVRYREGLYRSRYFIPVLTRSYLARSGSRLEAREIAQLTVAHRSSEHYYPLLPWVVGDPGDLEAVWARREPDDGDGFGWLLRHIPPLAERWSPSDLAAFVGSLVAGSRDLEQDRPVSDRRFLDYLRPDLSGVVRSDGVLRLSLRHPFWADRHFAFLLSPAGRLRYLGVEDRACGPTPGPGWSWDQPSAAASPPRAIDASPEGEVTLLTADDEVMLTCPEGPIWRKRMNPTSCRLSPMADLAAVGSASELLLVDRTGNTVASCDEAAWMVAWEPHGLSLVHQGVGDAWLRDGRSLEILARLPGPHKRWNDAAILSPWELVAVAQQDGVCLWHPRQGEVYGRVAFLATGCWAWDVSWAPGTDLLLACGEGWLRAWRLPLLELVADLEVPGRAVRLVLRSSGDWVVETHQEGDKVSFLTWAPGATTAETLGRAIPRPCGPTGQGVAWWECGLVLWRAW
jgi:hypothetical protein